jgi:hypothetical protein
MSILDSIYVIIVLFLFPISNVPTGSIFPVGRFSAVKINSQQRGGPFEWEATLI